MKKMKQLTSTNIWEGGIQYQARYKIYHLILEHVSEENYEEARFVEGTMGLL